VGDTCTAIYTCLDIAGILEDKDAQLNQIRKEKEEYARIIAQTVLDTRVHCECGEAEPGEECSACKIYHSLHEKLSGGN